MQENKKSSHELPLWILWAGVGICVIVSFIVAVMLDFNVKESALIAKSEVNETLPPQNNQTLSKTEEMQSATTITQQKANMRLRLNQLSEELSQMGASNSYDKQGHNAPTTLHKNALQRQEQILKNAQKNLEQQSKDMP